MTNPNDPAHPLQGMGEQPNGTFEHSCTGFTAREHAAIQLRVPNSGTDWLDAMICQSRRQEFVKASVECAMQIREGYVMDTEPNAEELAEATVKLADALLAELERQP